MSESMYAETQPAAADIIRRAAIEVERMPAPWFDEITSATIGDLHGSVWSDDPELREWMRRASMSNLAHWVSANVAHPGEPVAPNLSDEVIQTARNVARRGYDERILDSYRTGQSVAWQRWMRVVFTVSADLQTVAAALDRTAKTIADFVDATIAAVSDRIRDERSSLLAGANADRQAITGLLIAGEPVQRAHAEQVLAYPLSGTHVAAVVWDTSATVEVDALTGIADGVFRALGARRQLIVHVSTGTLWLWLTPTDVGAARRDLRSALSSAPDVDLALGTPHAGVDGFRASHLEAVAAQRYAAAIGARFVDYDDSRLGMLLDAVPDGGEEFARAVLGDFADASAELRETVRTFVREQCSITRSASQLHVHRNTVIRRLEAAERLLASPLATRSVEIAVALELQRRRA